MNSFSPSDSNPIWRYGLPTSHRRYLTKGISHYAKIWFYFVTLVMGRVIWEIFAYFNPNRPFSPVIFLPISSFLTSPPFIHHHIGDFG